MSSTPNVTYAPIDAILQLTSASSTTVPSTVYTGPASGQSTGGAKIGVFRAISTDLVKTINLGIYKTIGAVDHLIGYVSIGPAASAVSPTVVDILDLIRGSAMNLGVSTGLKVLPDVAPTAGKVVEVEVEGATF